MYEKYIYKSGKSSKISKYCTFLYSKHPPLIYMKTKFKCGSDKASHINEVVINVWYKRLYREVNPNKNCIKENQTR